MDFEASFNIVLVSLRQCLSLSSAETFTRRDLYSGEGRRIRTDGQRGRQGERMREKEKANSWRDTKVGTPLCSGVSRTAPWIQADVELTPEKCERARTLSIDVREAHREVTIRAMVLSRKIASTIFRRVRAHVTKQPCIPREFFPFSPFFFFFPFRSDKQERKIETGSRILRANILQIA